MPIDRRILILRWWLAAAGLLALAIVWPEFGVMLLSGFAFLPLGIIPCPSCCPANCDLLNDPFTTDNLATDWDDRAGTWTVGSGLLNTTSASALIVTVAAQDGGATGAYTAATITCTTTSDIGRVVAAYSDDSNYWFAEVQPGASNGTLKLFQRSGGANTQRGSTQTIAGYQANEACFVCIGIANGRVQAVAFVGSEEAMLSYTASVTTASTQGGLGTGAGSSEVDFDDFIFGVSAADDPNCYACAISGCSTYCTEDTPIEVAATFAGIVDGPSGCSVCTAQHNATVVIPDIGTVGGGSSDLTFNCQGNRTFAAGPFCVPTTFNWVLSGGVGSDVKLTVKHFLGASEAAAGGATFEHVFGTGPIENCTGLNSQSMTVVSRTTVSDCDFSAATCTVSTSP